MGHEVAVAIIKGRLDSSTELANEVDSYTQLVDPELKPASRYLSAL